VKSGRQNWRKEYSTLDGCQHADRWFFGMESTLPKEEEMNADAPSTHRSKPHLGLNFSGGWSADVELRANAVGAVELAFDHDDSDVVMETNVAAEVRCAIKDMNCQFFR